MDLHDPDWSAARGNIAVIPVTNPQAPLSALVGTWFDAPAWGPVNNPQLGAMLAAMLLPAAREHGVAAVVFAWQELPREVITGQYMPFTLPPQNIPAVFVDGEATATLLAGQGARIRLRLNITRDAEASTRTVWTMIEGTEAPEETIILITHTDGVNCLEENGHIAMLELAQRIAKHPCRRTIVFGFVTGHLRIPAVTAHGQASSRWLEEHPELWDGAPGHRSAVAGLGLEHFGARAVPADGTWATAPLEPELLYASTEELAKLALQQWDFGTRPQRVSRPLSSLHFGEAEPMFQRGVPTVALVTAPDYLLAEREDDYVDIAAMEDQIESFHRILRLLDTMPRDHIGVVEVSAAPSGLDTLQSALNALGGA
ncbi:hypothetical protein [Arthrobacter sp. RCC_34]|uniref:hypothetical protein n=1 Tax=Arthrobacter sp. RCC_34 TaxID=3239230 RepID=UPI0035261D7B